MTLDDIKPVPPVWTANAPAIRSIAGRAGVETTTGPLGQGLATSVGMAIAGQMAGDASFNRPDFPMFDYDVYALCGDGCMMEGVSSEAASLAGHLKLGNLCWIYDNNRITIEGLTRLAFTEDVATRFIGYGWNVTARGRRERSRDARPARSTPSRHDGPADARSSWTATSATARRTSRTRHDRERRAAGRGRDPRLQT